VTATTPITVRVQAGDFDLAAESEALLRASGDAGAIVSFTGVCRDEGGRLAALELEHYPGMAEEELTRIARQAHGRWALGGICVIHRYGRLVPGDNIVLVATAASHREAAFEAARFVMDYLKTQAPFWKKEHLTDDKAGAWVEARRGDDDAAARWKKD